MQPVPTITARAATRTPLLALATLPGLVGLVLLVVIAGACGSSGPTAQPGTTGGSPGDLPSLTPVPGGTTPEGPASTTETPWGPILDRLPADFPVHPEAVAADPHEDAVSGAFAVGSSGPEVTAWYQAALERGGYSTLALSGPFEDGSTIIDSVGPGSTDCRVETTIRPLSGTTLVTVLYGAACAG